MSASYEKILQSAWLMVLCASIVLCPSALMAQRSGNKQPDDAGRIPPPVVPVPVPVPVPSTEATTVVPLTGDKATSTGDEEGEPAAGAVDERVRFGVSLNDLEKRTEGAVMEVFWSHAETGVDAVSGFGFSILEAGEDLLVTVLPQVILRNGGVEMLDQLRVNARDAETTWPAELLLLDEGTGVGVLRIGGEDDEQSGKRERYRALNRLRLLRADRVAPATVVFGFETAGKNIGQRCVAGRVAGRDCRYLGESLPTSFLRLRMYIRNVMPGGPLIDESGNVVALMTDRVLEESDEIHAVPVPVLHRVLRDLGTRQKTGVGWIGATFHTESSTPQIVQVRGGSPANQAGLRSGDIVVSIGGRQVETLDDLADEFYYLSAGAETQIEVLRGLEKLSYPLVPSFMDERDLNGDGVDDQGPMKGDTGSASGSPSATVRARR